MAHKKSGQLTSWSEWQKHLRKIGKRIFWKGERAAERDGIHEAILDRDQEQNDLKTKMK